MVRRDLIEEAVILLDGFILSLEPAFRAEMLWGTATTEISQPGRTRLCCVSEFLGNLPIRVNPSIGCVILRALHSRSGTQNPLDPGVDWEGSVRANASSGK
jgi:hypothetical protein